MNNQLILVADSDPKNLQILKENLEASGFQVITVADGNKAWEEIPQIGPKLILTEINLPGLSGFQLLEKLQADPNTSSIPLIFLTNQREVQQRVRSFQLGAKDYLVKPLHVKEVIAHIRMVLRRIEKRQVNQTDQYSKFSGRLSELSLADLIESFSVERKTGILTLNNGNNRTGHVYFRNGAVINASLGDIRLENAIYQMLPWNRGYFSMVFKEVEVPDEISISNLGLLLEGIKRMERREKLLKQFPSPKTAFIITPRFQKILEKKKLPEDVKKFISLLDGKRDIQKIIDDSNYDDFKTLERLLRLYQQDFIKPTISPKIEKQPPKKEELPPVKKVVEKPIEKVVAKVPRKEEPPAEKVEPPAPEPEIMTTPPPIKQRIEKRRAEIIIPQEPAVPQSPKTPPPIETPAEEAMFENKQEEIPAKAEKETAPPKKETRDLESIEEIKPLAPSFNKEEFLRKQQKVVHKQGNNKPHIIKDVDKKQLLAIGLDEDSLDEVMDILTDNTFKTKSFDALPDLPIHFGKITHNEFDFITLLGIFVDKSVNSLIQALKNKLIGIIFIIDCTQQDIWEYANYLIHSIRDNFNLPYVVAITNFHEQNSITLDVIRYKLNLTENVEIITWDANDPSSIKKLLSAIISSPQDDNQQKTIDLLTEIVEKVTA